MFRRLVMSIVALQGCLGLASAQDATKTETEAGFVSLFDGKTMNGWKVNENQASWKVVDGCLVCKIGRAHV